MRPESRSFHRRARRYGGQGGFTKLDFVEIPRIKKLAFVTVTKNQV